MPGQIRPVPCDACGGAAFTPLFSKQSSRNETFQIVRCTACGLVQVNPQPDVDAVRPYYESEYFLKRTDRGYDNYFSEGVRAEITRVYNLNLRDLGFPKFADVLPEKERRSLDVGCAAGYFVAHMKGLGWDAEGIEISQSAAWFGIEKLGLKIHVDDFLSSSHTKPESYQLVTLWASLEHMHSPSRVLERCRELLRPGGRMILSTCRYGLLAKWQGLDWRFMNVPEHLYYFSHGGLISLCRKIGLELVESITYGSGMTTKKNAGLLYRTAKRIFDPAVKWTGQGDMMALHLKKV